MLNKQMTCGVPWCGRTVHSRNVCAPHYSIAARGTASAAKVAQARRYMTKSAGPGCKGNAADVEADAKEIVRQYLAGQTTTRALMKAYHVAYKTLARVLRAGTTPAQRKELKHRSRCAHARRFGFQPGQSPRCKRPKAAAVEARRIAQVNRQVAKLLGQVTIQWDCPCCGWAVRTKLEPDRCPKCGGGAFERIEIRQPQQTRPRLRKVG